MDGIRQLPPIAGSPALESRLHDRDLGPVRILVSGTAGLVRAELVVTDPDAALALAQAVDRAEASGHGLHGIHLRIRLGVATGADPSTSTNGSVRSNSEPDRSDGRPGDGHPHGDGRRPEEHEPRSRWQPDTPSRRPLGDLRRGPRNQARLDIHA